MSHDFCSENLSPKVLDKSGGFEKSYISILKLIVYPGLGIGGALTVVGGAFVLGQISSKAQTDGELGQLKGEVKSVNIKIDSFKLE